MEHLCEGLGGGAGFGLSVDARVCVMNSLSRLATVALAACGWRQTQVGGKHLFTANSPQSGLLGSLWTAEASQSSNH